MTSLAEQVSGGLSLTPEQETFVTCIDQEDCNIMLISCAGSGKTTALVLGGRALDLRSRRVLCCAFNTRITKAMEARMPSSTVCRGFNSLGHRAWASRINKQLDLQKFKNWKVADAIGLEVKTQFPDFSRAMALCKNNGLVPRDAKGAGAGLLPDQDDVWVSICDEYNLADGDHNPDWIADTLRRAMKVSIEMAWDGIIDFDDQLYMSALFQGDFPGFDDVLVDEVQDVTPIQRAQITRILKRGRLIASGDPHQSIYAFRGADCQSVKTFTDQFSCKNLSLSVSFRCPQAVVEEARKFVDHINPAPGATAGLVRSEAYWNGDLFREGAAILCRNTKPLIPATFALLREGKAATILGRDIGRGLASLVKKMKAFKIPDLKMELLEYSDVKCSEYLAQNKPFKAQHLQDQVGSILAVTKGHKVADTVELLDTIERLFSDEMSPITLSTVHKAKGLEWPQVAILDSWRMPSKYANTEDEFQQEINIQYVAVTRAMESLHYIDSDKYAPAVKEI